MESCYWEFLVTLGLGGGHSGHVFFRSGYHGLASRLTFSFGADLFWSNTHGRSERDGFDS